MEGKRVFLNSKHIIKYVAVKFLFLEHSIDINYNFSFEENKQFSHIAHCTYAPNNLPEDQSEEYDILLYFDIVA